MNHKHSNSNETYPMDKLLAKLSEQQAVLSQQNEALKTRENDGFASKPHDQQSSSNSLPITPATDGFPSTAPTTRPASATTADDNRQEGEEVWRLKLQLAQAQTHISKLDQELRTVKTEGEPIGYTGAPRNKPSLPLDPTWPGPEDGQSDNSDTLSANTFNRTRGIWGNPKSSYANGRIHAPVAEHSPANWIGGRGFNQGYMDQNAPFSPLDGGRSDRLSPDSDILMRSSASRRGNRFDSRMNSPQQFGGAYGGYNPPGVQYDPMMGGTMPGPMSAGAPMNGPHGLGPMDMGMYPQNPQSMGTQLSPYASEFTSKPGWKNEVCAVGDLDLHAAAGHVLTWGIDDPVRRSYLSSTHRATQLSTSS